MRDHNVVILNVKIPQKLNWKHISRNIMNYFLQNNILRYMINIQIKISICVYESKYHPQANKHLF